MTQDLYAIRESLLSDLDGFVRFFDRGGVDHEHGGVCCGLAATGERLTGLKFCWFNGRAIWTYGHLYRSGLLKDRPAPREGVASMQDYLLNVATRAAEFALTFGRDAFGGFVVEMTEQGAPLKAAEPAYIPTSGYGSAFVGEGLAELFHTTGVAATLDVSIDLLRAFVRLMDDPSREGDRMAGAKGGSPGLRTLGHHMICLNWSRQLHEASAEATRRGIHELPNAGDIAGKIHPVVRTMPARSKR